MSTKAKFDRAEVIEKAKNLYWEKGYHATSMRNLQDVIDMRPGSIYAAFGSKDNLFKEALNCYAQESTEHLANCIAAESKVLEGLKLFINSVAICNGDSAPNGMCMIVKSIAELTQNDSPELLAVAKTILVNVEASFTDIFRQAISNGEIKTETDPAELARFFQIQLIGLKTYAQIANNSSVIEKFIDDIFNQLQD